MQWPRLHSCLAHGGQPAAACWVQLTLWCCLLQETADGELIILHDFHLADAFPDTGPNIEPYKQLRAQLGFNTPLLIKVGPPG